MVHTYILESLIRKKKLKTRNIFRALELEFEFDDANVYLFETDYYLYILMKWMQVQRMQSSISAFATKHTYAYTPGPQIVRI